MKIDPTVTIKRPCKVFKYERVEVDGKSKWEKSFDYLATFHAFGTDYEEFEAGPGLHPVAIVERENGQVEVVAASMIKFEDAVG